ncbi:hypothetical protein PYCC9005_005786 [Savitreella phatthalungensis]
MLPTQSHGSVAQRVAGAISALQLALQSGERQLGATPVAASSSSSSTAPAAQHSTAAEPQHRQQRQ